MNEKWLTSLNADIISFLSHESIIHLLIIAINREVIRSQDRIVESISFFEDHFEIDTPFEVQKKEFIPKAVVSKELYESKERELEAPNGSSESVNRVNESNSLPLFETIKEETLDQKFTSSFEIITNLR